ncbi:MAG: transglutaminase domain-containing protein [Ruminococcaceae bacterium]|nr:transglutaminase domain-containing protein [Oscillospiraceae bacterium]
MKRSESRQAWILRNITALIMTFAVTYALNAYFTLQISPWFLLVGALAFDVLAMFVDRLKGKWVFWGSLLGLIVAGWIVLMILGVPVRELIRQGVLWVQEAVRWFLDYTNTLASVPDSLIGSMLPPVEPVYTLFFALAALAVCTLVFYPLSGHMISRGILAVLSLAGLVAMPFYGIELQKLPLFCVGVVIISWLIELVNLQFDRKRVSSKRSAGLFLYPVSVLLLFIAVVLPARDTPIRWQPIRDLFSRMSVTMESAEVTLKVWFGIIPEKFSVEFNGMTFSEEDGGIEVTEESSLMTVSTNGKTLSPVYLRGSVNSDYTGSGWVDRSELYFGEEEVMMELYEIMYAMHRSKLQEEPGEDLYKRTTLSVYYDDVVTKSLMFSAPLSQIDTGKQYAYDFYGSNVRFDRIQKIGTEYNMSYFETNWGNPKLQDFFRDLHGFRYADDETVVSELQIAKTSPYRTLYVAVHNPDESLYNDQFPDVLAERARLIREVYTGLPEDLPERVYDLAREITADAGTTYDKILAIEQYFEDRYTYTLTPEAFPEDRDFVDWFLFETDEGYCSYYATAAAVLARCVGLPSRYVEGVYIKDQLYSRDEAEVTNLSIHAWTEVYLEGYGWIPIEPTPGYSFGSSHEWERTPLSSGGSTQPDMPMMPMIPEQTPVEIPEQDGPSALELALLEAQRREELRRFWTWAVSIAGGVILLVGILSLILSRRAKARRYNRASDNEKIHLLMREILRCISSTGIHLKDHETLMEYVERAGIGFDFSSMKLQEAAMLFMRVRYAGVNATRMEVLGMYRYTRELRRESLKQMSFLRRIYFSVAQFVQ